MRNVVDAIIDCLARCYRNIREKYGSPVHMEMVKGDFEPYRTAGKFDPTKITTPISVVAGMSMVDTTGPVVFANFGERGSEHTATAMGVSWATPIAHKELVNMEVVPLESVPWTVALADRVKRMTHASLDTVLQPIVTRIAKLVCIQNGMNISALACNNPWGTHSVPSMIFHPHILELSLASMKAGFDLLRGVLPGGVPRKGEAHHFITEASLPYLDDGLYQDPSLGEPTLTRDQVGKGDEGVRLGPWVRIPYPVDYDGGSSARSILSLSYTGNPFTVSTDGQIGRAHV